MSTFGIFDSKFEDLLQKDPKIIEYYNSFNPPDELQSLPKTTDAAEKTILSCSYCKVTFKNVDQQREHYKLDWHRYNLKRHLDGRLIVSEEDFETRNDDLSSISGSESESEETSDNPNMTYLSPNQGRVYVKCNDGSVFLVYRCLLAEKKQEILDVKTNLTKLKNKKLAVIMLGGGHFAGAIFDGPNAILHKTFHCYTVRAGQGGSQSARDNKNSATAPKSAGASLRRYNEQALAQHVADIMLVWKDELAKCTVIAFRAPGPYNKAVLFGGKSPVLQRDDARLRVIPFSTRRATFKEVTRVYEMITAITFFDSIEHIPKRMLASPDDKGERRRNKVKGSVVINRAKSRESNERPLPCVLSSEEEDISANSPDITDREISYELQDHEVSFTDELEPFTDSLTPEQRRVLKHSDSKKTQAHLERQAKIKEEKHKAKMEAQIKRELCKAIVSENLNEFDNLLQAHPHLVNAPVDVEENTALHLSSQLEKHKFIQKLLDLGADVCAKNSNNHTPYTVTQDKATRAIFREFAKDNPDKFNYNKAQIPLPEALSQEQMEERKLKQQQIRKAKREKEREKKKTRASEAKEKDEKDRFAQLSDREKRALAAERRILNQQGVVISRCFLCGSDMSGKVPFEYSGYRFCSVDCLKAHRMRNPIVLS